MIEKRVIKYFFIISCLIAISFPIINIYYIFPSFSTLLSKNAEDESLRIAKHISLMLVGEDNELKKPQSYLAFLEKAKEEFNLDKIKLFLVNGEVIYSTDTGDIGDINDKIYFHEIVIKGSHYSKLVQKATKSLDGQFQNHDVVETYMPIMSKNKVIGALEIYLDITIQHGSLKSAVLDSSLISFVLMFGFFLIMGILLLTASNTTFVSKSDQDLHRYQSPLYLLLITIASLFIVETFLMMIISAFPPLTKSKKAIIDATLLVMIVSPALYYFLFHPILLHINKRRESEDKLKVAYSELSDANTQLENEIIERKKAEEEIIQSQKEWEDTFDIMTDAITIHDKDFNIIKSNKSAEKFLNLPFLKTDSTKCYKYYHGADQPLDGCPSCDCMTTGIAASFEIFEPYLKKHIEIRALPRFDSKGNINGTIHLVRDISERKEMDKQLKAMSITDELTGLYNRRGFFNLLKQQLKIIKREKSKVLLLYADIDNLKDINDVLGHSKGDMAIIDAANILKATYRESDIIARLGGDEFVVFPVGDKETHIDMIINRLQKTIDDHNEQKERGYILSMSIGIATYDPADPRSTDDLLAEADRSMYKNKRSKKKG